MKPRLILSLLVCACLLAGCYRQTEEPFQQVDSAEVAEVTAAVAVAEGEDAASADVSAGEGEATAVEVRYITPESLPGQVEQPTAAPLTSEAESTAPPDTITPFIVPSPTLTFEEQLDPDDECVYQVQAGNVLFRLALAWGTTYQTIMEVNQLDSENLSIGQLLLIPDCEPEESEVAATEASAAQVNVTAGPLISEGEADTVEEAATAEATVAATPTITATPRPEIHVVSAGETIESISLRYRVDVRELITLNELTNPNRLSVGQELQLPP
ncbi:MAG: LysM peptidoglycan-binding domain-containing protein [Chloroflexota bacterium]|nr:LysM peptidoglycan-binding domain-containing protein [Chloroflexota bacterium]MDE2947393.1 LysM peptidoglycan-binding domain-containing protein [Chloroflexota bacterium]